MERRSTAPSLPAAAVVVENPWLLECYPLCVDCIEAGERIELCFEGRGCLHNFWPVAGRAICLDCGEPDDERENKNPVPGQGQMEEALKRGRLKGTIAARDAEIAVLVTLLEDLRGPKLSAIAMRLERLRADRDWYERRLAEETLYGAEDGLRH